MEKVKKKLTIDYKIFWPSVILIIAMVIPLAMYEKRSLATLNSIFEGIVGNFGWLYIWYSILMVFFGFYLSFSKYGNVVLGDPGEKPRFTMFQFFSIIVAMGIGSTIMRTGTIQWALVAMDPPFGVEPLSAEALMWGNPYSMFLWSLQTFAIFSLSAPAFGYILHVRKKPVVRVSEVCRCVFGDRFTDGLGGKVLDVLFLIAIVAGSATFLGLGTPIVSAIVSKLFHIEMNFLLTFVITIIWIALFTTSVYLGLEKGIKNLSVFNMYLAAFFALFLIVLGPTLFIINYFTESVGFLFSHYIDLSFYTDSLKTDGSSHIQRYSVFWWAYDATWALLHGIFAAAVAKGRTIRQVLMTYFFAPLTLAWLATGILGGTAMNQYLTGKVPVMKIIENSADGVTVAIAEILGSLPAPTIMMVIFSILTMVFFGTTLDSTTFSISAYTDTQDMSKVDPNRSTRIIWAGLIAILALVMLRIGGLVPLEVVSGLIGFPIMFIQFVTIYAVKKMMDEDKAWLNNVQNRKRKVKEA